MLDQKWGTRIITVVHILNWNLNFRELNCPYFKLQFKFQRVELNFVLLVKKQPLVGHLRGTGELSDYVKQNVKCKIEIEQRIPSGEINECAKRRTK